MTNQETVTLGAQVPAGFARAFDRKRGSLSRSAAVRQALAAWAGARPVVEPP